MALILLNPGETRGTYGEYGLDNVFGSTGNETVVIHPNGKVVLDGSFNAGGDTVRILGNAGNYTASVVGSTLVLTNAGGANIVIPFGVAGATIQFADATRTLAINTTTGNLQLGTQVIAATGTTEVADGTGTPPPVDGDEFFLTPGQDSLVGTSGDDLFIADLNQVNGLQVNTLGTGDRIGHQTADRGGYDVLEAQLTRGSTYGDGNAPIQPRLNGINVVKIESLQSDLPNGSYNFYGPQVGSDSDGMDNYDLLGSKNTEVYFNAKDVRGHDQIWSWKSDANLTVLDLTTVLANGGHDNAKNTGDITIGMGYTGSKNTNWDASDLKVFFDPDYLLSGQTAESAAYFWLLDEAADLAHRGVNLLERINVDGLRFKIDGGPTITLRDPATTTSLTHANFVALLQDELAALKASGIVPADMQLVVEPSSRTTGLDDGSMSSPIPVIVLKTETGAVITPIGFSQIEEPIGAYDVFGDFTNEASVEDLPVSVKIALEKAGEGASDVCDGGALIVGSMDKYNQGITEFNVTVYGDASRPSILRLLDSTAGALETINITSNNTGFPTSTWASLAIGATNEDLNLIDASTFKGDLQLGAYDADCEGGLIVNLKTLLAIGGGNVSFFGEIDSSGSYSYTTGAGNDVIYLDIDGDALDKAGDGLAIVTGDGNDYVHTYTDFGGDELPNQIILNNVNITTGNGNDTVWTEGEGNFRISTGAGADTIYTDNSGSGAEWVFNVDMGSYSSGSDSTSDLPGVPLQYSLIGGGKLTVTFSGAGINGDDLFGGVMTDNGKPGDLGEAIATKNGIESTVTIDVDGTRNHYGTQRDINDAMLRAINDHPVLSKLLKAYIADNNTLVVESLIDGVFRTEDLDISITRPSGNYTSSMLAEAATVGISTTALTTATPIGLATDAGVGVGMSLGNSFYSGVNNNNIGTTVDAAPFNNLHYAGSAYDSFDSDNVVNAGDNNDVIVLAAHYEDSDSANGYWSLDGQLYDDGSNDRIVMTGNFGNDTIINFVVAGVDTYVRDGQGGPLAPLPNSGFDVLDFTAYLSAARGTFVTLDDYSGGDTVQDFAGVTINPAEVVIVDFLADLNTGDGDGIETFAGLTASVVQNAINNVVSFTNWGNFDGGEFSLSDTLNPGQSVSAVLLVQNEQNLGQYKVFQVTWTDNATDSLTPPTAVVVERGELDFGASLSGSANADGGDLDTGIDELNLFGSYENSFFDGSGVNAFGPDGIPHWV